ncbi:MAG TPA: hypothetical protein VLE19_05430 [Pyrinomonadaceae bacterium]|nr:hypothetical protein [Pyrinomonadaceae bacterium]
MPKDPTKNIDRYKIAGGELNPAEFQENQQALAEQHSSDEAQLIPGTPPEVRVPEALREANEAITERTGPAIRSTKKRSTKKAAAKKSGKKNTARKSASKKQAASKKTSKASKKRTTTKKAASKKSPSAKKRPAKKSSAAKSRKAARKR